MSTKWCKMTPDQKIKARARQKRYWENNKERLAAKKRRHYYKFHSKYLEIERARNYKKLYGIGISDYERILQDQNNMCKICGSDKSGHKGQYFAVDHCHVTGQVRGLLCIACNVKVGWFETYKEKIQTYLE